MPSDSRSLCGKDIVQIPSLCEHADRNTLVPRVFNMGTHTRVVWAQQTSKQPYIAAGLLSERNSSEISSSSRDVNFAFLYGCQVDVRLQ